MGSKKKETDQKSKTGRRKREPEERGRSKEIRWAKLDNTAHLFPAIAGEGMTNVYRVAIYLKEDIVRETLQEALEIVLPKFSIFNCRLRQGFFWYYFEENGKKAPTVVEETTYPCQYMDEKRNRNYLFRVTYYGHRINLEAFHVLTDGTGAFYFLKELAYQYLRLAHPELREKYGDGLSSQTSLNTEDSFLQNFKKSRISGGYKAGRAYLLKGPLFPRGKMGILHGHMPVEEVKQAAKRHGATLNEYLVAVFIWSAYQAYLKGMPSRNQLSVSVPVNLRPYFNSVTTKNFFVMVTAIFHPKEENQSFEDVIESVKTSLREQMTREHLEEVLSYNVTGEQMMILRTMPLVFKNPGLRGVYNMHARANTATVTNMGNITVSEPYQEYIERFDVLLSRSKGQNLKMALSTYNGTLSATITSAMKDTRLQRVFFRYLASQGISVTIESNGVYYE
ncbi:MAG: hypothetical protein LUC32_04330 [Clostridiales bacterium]|nr:hypothetical protein [Clostridiales bacterium]